MIKGVFDLGFTAAQPRHLLHSLAQSARSSFGSELPWLRRPGAWGLPCCDTFLLLSLPLPLTSHVLTTIVYLSPS
jgi:hypothetical protein